MKKKTQAKTFTKNPKKDVPQPPRNKTAPRVDIKTMLAYSARKNIANVVAEYSTLKPATSSASASGKSKGVRFVSANPDIMKRLNSGKKGKQNHPDLTCAWTISIRFKDPVANAKGKTINPKFSS